MHYIQLFSRFFFKWQYFFVLLGELWEKIVKKRFPKHQREEMETYRELYERYNFKMITILEKKRKKKQYLKNVLQNDRRRKRKIRSSNG